MTAQKPRSTRLKTRRGIPLHVQAEGRLRELIAEPRFTTGGELLTDEVSLSQQWGISRNTLRQAIARLVNEGRLRRVPGQGTRVLTAPVSGSAGAWVSFTREMRERGIVVKNFSARLEKRVPSAEIAADLGLAPGEEACLLSRVRGWEEEPAILAESWLNAEIADADEARFRREPLFELLEQLTGVTPARSVEKVSAEAAPAAVATALKIATGTPVLLRRRVTLDKNGKPLEVNLNWCRGDRYTLSLELS